MQDRGRSFLETNLETGFHAEQMELRTRVRHRLAADAAFTWKGAQHTSLGGEGVTRDISVCGAFMFSLTSPPVGATIRLEILLLPLDSGARTLRLETDARVIRVEHANVSGSEGFAVVLDSLSLGEGGKEVSLKQR